MRPLVPSLQFSPISGAAGLTSPNSPPNQKTTFHTQFRSSEKPCDTDSDDGDSLRPRRVLSCGLNMDLPEKVVDREETLNFDSSPARSDFLLNMESNSSTMAVRKLADNMQSILNRTDSHKPLKHYLMTHILECVSTLAVVDHFGQAPTHKEVFKAAVCHMLDNSYNTAAGSVSTESYPMTWIHELYLTQRDTNTLPNPWLPLHWCGALSSEESEITFSHLRGIMDEDHKLSLVGKEYDVSVLSLAVAKSRPSLAFVEAILSVRRDAVRVPDKDGALPLMYAAAWNEDITVLMKLYDEFPGAVKEKDAFGYTPLHFACYAGTLDAVKFLLSKYPKAAKSTTTNGAIPLHACASNSRYSNPEMSRILVECYREGIFAVDSDGSLPLHVAAQFSSIEVIRYLCGVYPAAAGHMNYEGLLPMHMAGLRKHKCADILSYLTEPSRVGSAVL